MLEHEIFQRSVLLVQNMIEIIDHPAYDTSARIAVSGNLCQMAIEHSCAFRALSEHRMFASSFVVLRAQFESTVRAVWVLYCATDEHLMLLSAPPNAETDRESAKRLPQAQTMLNNLEEVPTAKVPFGALSEFKSSAWGALNSYVHAGTHPLNRLVEGYPKELLISNVKVSNALAMVAAMQFSILTGMNGLQKELFLLNERFRDCLPQHK